MFLKKHLKLTLSLILIVSFFSCEKAEFKYLVKDKEYKKSDQINNSLLNPTNEWVLSVPIPSVNSLQDLFLRDRFTIRNIVNANDNAQAENYVRNLADQIAGYYYHIKNIDLRNDFSDDPEGVVLLGLFFAAKEFNNLYQLNTLSVDSKMQKVKSGITPLYIQENPVECFITAVSSIIGIGDARHLWRSILAGATEQTAIAALKLIGRRTASGIVIGFAIYEVGGCLGWW